MLYLLRTDKMYMRIDTSRGGDQARSPMHLRRSPDDHARVHTIHHVRVTRLADPHDPPIPDPDVPFHDPPMIDDDHTRYHQVQHPLAPHRRGRLPHPIADGLPSSKLDLIPIHGTILLDLYEQFRVGQPHPI